MALPDASRLLDLPAARWKTLGARLRELDVVTVYPQIAAIGGEVFDPACYPLHCWHLRRRDRLVDRALRIFFVNDPVTEDEARSALGPGLLEELLAAGLVVRSERGEVASPFKLRIHDDLLFFADHLSHGGEAVMGAGALTLAVLQASMPSGRIDKALDLGCGAGLIALGLARHAEAVVATDINPRAVTLARANAALNGVENIDFRTGDLFAPVAGERFDRIVSQPPFYPQPDGMAEAAYFHGGRRGDELALRILREMPEHLGPAGRGVVIAEWPVLDDEPLEKRLRGVVPATTNLLVLASEGPDIDAFCINDIAYENPDFGAEYQRKVILLREHVEKLGLKSLRLAAIVVEPARAEGWTGSLAVRDLHGASIDAALVDALVRAHALLAGGREALLAARLKIRPETAFAVGKGPLVRVVFPAGSPLAETALDPGAYRVVQTVDAAPTVGAAIKRLAKEGNVPPPKAIERFLPAIGELLVAGILEVS